MGGSGVRGLMRGLVGALLPVQCAGCRAWDEVLCPSCRSLAGCPAHVASLEGVRGPLPLVAIGDYDGPLRRIVLAAKHSAHTDVTDFLNEAGARLGTALGGVLGVAGAPAAAVGALEGGFRSPGERWRCGWCPRPLRGRGACGVGRWRCRWRALLPELWRQARLLACACAFGWWTLCGCAWARPPSRARPGHSVRWGAWGRCVRSRSRGLACVLLRWMTW